MRFAVSKPEGCGQDKLPRVGDREQAPAAVGIGGLGDDAIVVQEIADVELHVDRKFNCSYLIRRGD